MPIWNRCFDLIFSRFQAEEDIKWDDRVEAEIADSFEDCCNQMPLNGPPVEQARSLLRGLKACMTHFHKKTCTKNQHDGTDVSCRMEFPRMIVSRSRFLSGNDTFLLRRDTGNLVPFCAAWMKAQFGNHLFSLIAEQGRQERRKAIYRMAKLKDPDIEVGCWRT